MSAPAAPVQPRLADIVTALEARARAANTVSELGFSIANDSYGLLGFRQALLFGGDSASATLLTVSGLARPAEDSPYLIWLRRAWPWLRAQCEGDGPAWIAQPGTARGMPAGLLDGWQEWWPAGVWVQPIARRSGERLGWAVFLLDAAPPAPVVQALARLAATWGYCWEMLAGKPRSSWRSRWSGLGRTRRYALLAAVVALLFIPVRHSSLAPAEVISLDAQAVTAPIEGVVKAIHVRPNQNVKAGEVLFSLDDTTLRNRLEVAQKSVAVADAELQVATQKAFDSFQSKSDLALLTGRANEKRAELEAIRAQLARVDIVAPRAGVAVFADADEWLGRPVTTGERIMLLANPAKPGVMINLPAADAIALEPGATVKLFLTVMPLAPFDAKVSETSYQAIVTPEGVASYRLRAVFDEDPGRTQQARIGLRGTAKIYGSRVFLGYYLLRRPLASVREWTGW